MPGSREKCFLFQHDDAHSAHGVHPFLGALAFEFCVGLRLSASEGGLGRSVTNPHGTKFNAGSEH